MAIMSAPSKPIKDPAALLACIIRYADSHYAREGWLAARDFLSRALEINPDYPRLLGSLGSLQFQLQEYPAACAPISAAKSCNPDNPDLRTQRTTVLPRACSSSKNTRESLTQTRTKKILWPN